MDRKHAEELLKGTGPSSAPSPYSLGLHTRRFQVTPDLLPMRHSQPLYNMPIRGDGSAYRQQANQFQHQAEPPPLPHPSPPYNMTGRGEVLGYEQHGYGQQASQLQYQGSPGPFPYPAAAYDVPSRSDGRGYGQQPSQMQQPADPSPLYHTRPAFNMPGRADGCGHGYQASQSQHQLPRPPSVLVIDDSDDDAQGEGSGQPSSAQDAMHEPMDRYSHHSQEPMQSIESVNDDDGNWDLPYARGNRDAEDTPEDQHGSLYDDAEVQTRALLHLPEVDIPEGERLETPRGLTCDLLPHQRVGLTWLVRQEQDPNKKGSILADGMGLGKTIEALALIVSRRCDPRHPLSCKTTLIVAPLGLLPQWQNEIQKKVTLRYGRKLSTIVFHGPTMKHVRIQELLQYDIVLCTYGKLVSEYNLYTRGPRIQCKLLSSEAKFYRVILDEAHFIKNKKARTALAVCQLQTVHRLCMTGTPLMNNVTELYPLIRFLRIKPYDTWTKFSEDIDRPIRRWKSGMETPAMLRLQTLVKSLILRRNKDSHLDGQRIIDLEERTDVEVYVEFDEDQKAFYEALVHRQRLKFNKYLKAGTVMRNYVRVLTWLLRLRQACDHPYLIQNHCIPDVCGLDAEGMIDLALRLPPDVVATLKATQHFECPKCAEFADNQTANPVIISPCGHYICAECYSALMEESLGLAEEAEDPDKFACPDEWCDSIITPDNILMHNFFVDAQKGAVNRMGSAEDTDEASDDEIEVIEIESEDEAEGMDGNELPHGDNLDRPSADQQHRGFSEMFVAPNPDEEEYLGLEHDDIDSEISDSQVQESQIVGGRSNTRVSTVRRGKGPAQQNIRGSILRGSSGGQVMIERSAAMPPGPQARAGSLHDLPSKGSSGNPVNLDDEEEMAAYIAVSRQMAAVAYQQRPQNIKEETGDENFEDLDVPNFDGPGSPAPRSKRKGFSGNHPDLRSKRARASRPYVRAASSHRADSDMNIKSEDEEGVVASRSDYQANVVDNDDQGQPSRVPSHVMSRDSIVDPAGDFRSGSRGLSRRPKLEEEDVKLEVHRLGQRAREVLQRPFVSLSNKRQLADHSKRAMAAYQKRIADEWVASAKTTKIMELMQKIRRDHPGEKTLIFSIWTVFLDMLEPPLQKEGFKYTVYSGGMKSDNRTAAVQTFMTNPELDVMLISLCAGSCGLNLTAANHVILTEPFWNPFTEEQAIDRAHRLGQEKPVTVYRVLVKGTIEDDIIQMQKKKRDLVGTALGDAQIDSPVHRLGLEELRALFGI